MPTFNIFLEIPTYKVKFLVAPLKNSYLYYTKTSTRLLPDSY